MSFKMIWTLNLYGKTVSGTDNFIMTCMLHPCETNCENVLPCETNCENMIYPEPVEPEVIELLRFDFSNYAQAVLDCSAPNLGEWSFALPPVLPSEDAPFVSLDKISPLDRAFQVS